MTEVQLTVDQAMAQAAAHHKAGRFPDAERLYRAVLQALPDHPIANHNLGLLAHHCGRSDIAVAFIEKAIALNGNISAFHNNLGEALRALGRFEESIAAYRRSLALEPDDAVVHNNLGCALQAIDLTEEARRNFNRALEINPAFAEAHDNLGHALRLQGNLEEAEKNFKRAISANPSYWSAHFHLAHLYLIQERKDEALAMGDIASRLENNLAFSHARMGSLFANCGAMERARRHLEIALERDPRDPEDARLILARIGMAPIPERASAAHLEKLYSVRANTWDRGTAADKSYRGADLVAHALRRLAPDGNLDILDAGCGTGQVGSLVSDLARTLDGVDLSGHMLETAKRKGIYRSLHRGDLIEFLKARPQAYDAITCAATLIHFGDLRPAFEAVAHALRPNGLFIFTLFPDEENPDGFSVGALGGLGEGGCYVHGQVYIARLAQDCGFEVEGVEKAIHEYRDGTPVYGLIGALQRHIR